MTSYSVDTSRVPEIYRAANFDNKWAIDFFPEDVPTIAPFDKLEDVKTFFVENYGLEQYYEWFPNGLREVETGIANGDDSGYPVVESDRPLKLRRKQCGNCPFLQRNQDMLRPEYWGYIYQYLMEGTNHICHTTNEHICKGGRDWQLNAWTRIGIISEPTNEALFESQRLMGIEPKYTEYDEE